MMMRKIGRSPVLWLIVVILLIFHDFVFSGKIPMPADTLVGSYLPWLDYKWGYAVGVPVKNPLISDIFSAFLPWKKLSVDLLSRGIMPLWNRYSFSGTPLLATFHSAVFFPANLLLLLPLNFGWGLFIFLSSLSAALSMYLFLGNLVGSRTGRFVGALIYAFAGPMTTWGEFGTAVWAASFLPLILYFFDQITIAPKRIYFLLLSLSIGVLIFAGHVQLLTYTAFLAPLYFFHRQKVLHGKFDFRLTKAVCLSALLGLGLGAIQLVPSLEFFGRSIRSEENYLVTYNYGLSHWTQLIRLWAADFFGNPVTINHFSPFAYHEYSSYLGALSLPLVVALLLSGKKNWHKHSFFILLFFGILLFTFANPVSRFAFSLHIPLLTFSSASRLFFILNLAVAVLVGLSLDNIISDKRSFRRIRIVILILSLITIAGLFFVDHEHQIVSLRNSLLYLSIFQVFLVVSFLFSGKKKLLFLIIALIFSFDLGHYYLKYNPFVNPALIFPQTPVIKYLQDQPGTFRIAIESTNLLPANTWTFYKLESVEGYDPLYINDYAHFFHRLNATSYFNGVSRYAMIEGFDPKYFAATNVKYILVKTKDSGKPRKSALETQLEKNNYTIAFVDKSVTVYENHSVLDRAYFVDNIRFAKDKNEVGQILDNPRFDPTKEAVVLGNSFAFSRGDNTVVSLVHQDNVVKIKAVSQEGGFLVLADSYDPGWKGYINGQETPVYQVNGSLRGVRVPQGDNIIEFRYAPKSFRYGMLITLTSLLLILVQYTRINLTKRTP